MPKWHAHPVSLLQNTIVAAVSRFILWTDWWPHTDKWKLSLPIDETKPVVFFVCSDRFISATCIESIGNCFRHDSTASLIDLIAVSFCGNAFFWQLIWKERRKTFTLWAWAFQQQTALRESRWKPWKSWRPSLKTVLFQCLSVSFVRGSIVLPPACTRVFSSDPGARLPLTHLHGLLVEGTNKLPKKGVRILYNFKGQIYRYWGIIDSWRAVEALTPVVKSPGAWTIAFLRGCCSLLQDIAGKAAKGTFFFASTKLLSSCEVSYRFCYPCVENRDLC